MYQLQIYRDEIPCQRAGGKNCNRNAQYLTKSGHYQCELHSRNVYRKLLAEDPEIAMKEQASIELHQFTCDIVAQKQTRGKIIGAKLKPRVSTQRIAGYLNVYPYCRQNPQDGIDCKSLSPFLLGPVVHNQPGIPQSLNLQNFQEGSKLFKSEIMDDGTISPEFYRIQRDMFQDPKPRQHKNDSVSDKCCAWIWTRQDGTTVRCSYVTSRQFFCHFYEQLVVGHEDYQHLCQLRDQGYNLMIVGDGSRNVSKCSGNTLAEKLEKCYLNTSRSFGHELVLLTMLSLDSSEYPWRKYRSENIFLEHFSLPRVELPALEQFNLVPRAMTNIPRGSRCSICHQAFKPGQKIVQSTQGEKPITHFKCTRLQVAEYNPY